MNDNVEQNPLAEFISAPTTISLHVAYTPILEQIVLERPYLRLGKMVGNYAIVYTSIEYIAEPAIILSLNSINTYPHPVGLLGEADLEDIGVLQVQNNPNLGFTGKGVLLGFVDTGIDYANDAFRYLDGSSRIQYIWDQSINDSPPSGYYYGTEYTKEQLNEALNSEDPYSVVPHQDTAGHGTFLASVAGGSLENQNLGAAPEAEFIVVKMKSASAVFRNLFWIPEDKENVYTSIDLMLGIQYLIEKAEELDRPISICIGVGSNIGGHDGLSPLEEYINMVSRRTGVCVSVAAGNESQTKHHTSGKFTKENQDKNMDIRVGSESGSFLTMIVSGPSDRLSVSVVSPTGELVSRFPSRPGTRLETKLILERATIIIEYHFPIDLSGVQLTVVNFLNPTPGLWRVILHSDIFLEGTYNAWLPISSLSPPELEFTEPDPYTTVVNPATAIGVICCGAYNSEDGSLYVNSSWGPTRISLIAPDLVAPGVNVIGMYPSGLGTMSGTSVSAAVTAGSAALLLQWGILEENDPLINTNRIRTFLIRGCVRSPALTYPNYQWGYGKLNMYNVFTSLTDNI